MKRTTSAAALVTALVAAYGLPIGAAQAAGAQDATSIGAGVYVRNCASCHGATGQGNGPVARALRPPPTDFVTTPVSAERAYQVTRGGGVAAGLAPTMPAFERSLSQDELHAVAAYIASFSNGGVK